MIRFLPFLTQSFIIAKSSSVARMRMVFGFWNIFEKMKYNVTNTIMKINKDIIAVSLNFTIQQLFDVLLVITLQPIMAFSFGFK